MSSFITRRQDIYNIGIANKFFKIVNRFTILGAPVLNQFYFYVEINNILYYLILRFVSSPALLKRVKFKVSIQRRH